MADYLAIYKSMEPNRPYTATELGVHPSSLTAMVNRGMLERHDTKPRTYVAIPANELAKVITLLRQLKPTNNLFTSYKRNETLGMCCIWDNNRILDCWGKPYSMVGVYKVWINGEEILL